MKKTKTEWTWKEIAALRANDKGEARAQFIAGYGDRAKVALMAAGHKPETWAKCVLTHFEGPGPGPCDRFCPLQRSTTFRREGHLDTCSEDSMEVYARMVRALGVEHKPKKLKKPRKG